MAIERTRIVFGSLTIVIVAVLMGASHSLIVPKFRELEVQLDRRQELRDKIATQEQSLADVKRKMRRFETDPEFVEHIGRLNHRVRPGEIIFVYGDQQE